MLPNSRTGNRYGNFQAVDHMAHDGLTNAYDGRPWACSPRPLPPSTVHPRRAGRLRDRIGQARAGRAGRGRIRRRDRPVKVSHPQGRRRACDRRTARQIRHRQDPDPAPGLPKDGTVTAASSSSISDGAAATVLLSADEAGRRGLQPLARIVAHATHSQEPEWFTTAPIGAIRNVLDKAGWSGPMSTCSRSTKPLPSSPWRRSASWAFPTQDQRQRRCLRIGPPDRASGARLVVTLLNALRKRGGKRGIASLCIGGGEATALAIELI
jgi:acetyl-CoA C-acetyltransferase